MLPFVLAPFGLLQSRFDLHPAMHEINAGGESQKRVEQGWLNPILILMNLPCYKESNVKREPLVFCKPSMDTDRDEMSGREIIMKFQHDNCSQ